MASRPICRYLRLADAWRLPGNSTGIWPHVQFVATCAWQMLGAFIIKHMASRPICRYLRLADAWRIHHQAMVNRYGTLGSRTIDLSLDHRQCCGSPLRAASGNPKPGTVRGWLSMPPGAPGTSVFTGPRYQHGDHQGIHRLNLYQYLRQTIPIR
ncbi:hypothetical protein QE152_g10810 [Popillia japonica]|uniref:Uncharacterized protein n=1 Tax=Popillia japonica TaxID=7064 RepID=A0AAW1LTJ0_POPJA